MAKIAAWIAGGLVLLVVAAAVAGLWWVSSDSASTWLAARGEAATGRKTSIGDIDIDWGWTPTVRLSDVAVANAEWGEAEHMLKARAVAFSIELWPLLRGDLVLPHLDLDQPEIAVERNEEGRSNWSFSEKPGAAAASEAVAPDERSEAPVIGLLAVRDGRISYRDAARRLALDGHVATGEAEASATEQLRIELEGTLEDKPLEVRLVGGSILALRETREPYPVSLDVSFGETDVTIEGTLAEPFTFGGADVAIRLSGPSLSEVFPLFRIPAPPTPPYEAKGQLTREGDVWRIDGFGGQFGGSDLAGMIMIDRGAEPPMLTADLSSERLDFEDLAPLTGARPGGRDEKRESLFPDVELKVERLKVMNMDVTLKAPNVVSREALSVQSLETTVKVRDGRLVASPLRLGVADGTITGQLVVNAREAVPSVSTDVGFEKLALPAFFRSSRFFDTTGGTLHGSLRLLGSGHSLADVMGSADGEAVIEISRGAFSGLLIEAAGVDLSEALVLYVGADSRVPIRCGMGRATVEDGVANFRRIIVDTQDSVLYARGWVDLRDESLDLAIQAEAKDFSLIDLDAPVHVRGAIREPKIGLGTPDRPDLPLFELGNAVDLDCDALRDEVQRGG